MDSRSSRGAGWLAFSAVALTIGGIFAAIDGMVAVYRSTFFAQDAVFVFSDLNTWGWVIFGLGVTAIVSGLTVLSGSQIARWFGVLVAGAGALGQMLFVQAYPLWSLMITAVYFLAIYGLLAYGGRESAASAASSYDEIGESQGTLDEPSTPTTISDVTARKQRAA
jgi:hypothetical protein